MAPERKLDEQINENFRLLCKLCSATLQNPPADPARFERELEQTRKAAEETWRATHDALNIWGTAVEHHIDPQNHPQGADLLIMHFQAYAGALFNEEFQKGLI